MSVSHHLCDNPAFRGAFRTVVFAVLDTSRDGLTFRPSAEHFGFSPAPAGA